MTEFDCRHCGMHVYSYGPDPAHRQDLCDTCRWLEEEVSDQDREALRVRLGLERRTAHG